jgi:hypothetical protein
MWREETSHGALPDLWTATAVCTPAAGGMLTTGEGYSRRSGGMKNQLCLIKKAALPGPGLSLRCTRATRPGAPLECPRCHSPMNVIAVISDLDEVKKILHHVVKIGRSPPGLGAPGWIQTSCNLSSVSLIAPGEYCVLRCLSAASERLPLDSMLW